MTSISTIPAFINKSITTLKDASARLIVTIDKIDFYPRTVINIEEVKEYWKANNLSFQLGKTSKGKLYLECSSIKFLFSSHHCDYFNRVITNPNHFKSYNNYIQTLNLVVPIYVLKQLKITQLDIALDFINFSKNQLLNRLIVSGKRAFQRIISNSGKHETTVIGKDPKSTKIYNRKKFLESKGEIFAPHIKHITRLELSIKGKKNLPTQDIFRLKEALKNENYNPLSSYFLLKSIRPAKIDYKKDDPKIIEKKVEFNTLLKSSGLQFTKQFLNNHRNFSRDYREFVNQAEKTSLNQIYKRKIAHYLDKSDWI